MKQLDKKIFKYQVKLILLLRRGGDTTENDYGGQLDFSNVLALNGEEISISSSVNEISDSGWVVSYLKGQKNANLSLQK